VLTLFRVNDQYQTLGIRPEDFAIVMPDDWSPIQINPNDQVVRDAVKKLQEATTKPCGPDAPTLAFKSFEKQASQRRWWQKSPVTRESAE
jgi:hypothetical protein